jgi:hypothetical protein
VAKSAQRNTASPAQHRMTHRCIIAILLFFEILHLGARGLVSYGRSFGKRHAKVD